MRRAHQRRTRRAPRPRAGLVVCLAVCLAVAACTSSSAPGPTTSRTAIGGHLVWWDISTQTGAVSADHSLVDGFMAANPAVTVDVKVMAPDDARTRFDTAAQSTAGAPDVITVDSSWIPEWGYRGYLARLDGTVAARPAQDVLPALQSVQSWDGRLVAVARSADATALLYNPRLLARAHVAVPRTWAEVAAARLRLTAQGVQTLYASAEGDGLLPWTYGDGGSLLDSSAKLILVNQPASVAGLTQRLEMQATGVVVDDPSPSSVDTMRMAFRTGRVAMILDSAAALPLLTGGSAFPTQSSIGVATVPAGTVRSSGPMTATAYAVYSGSTNLTTAIHFVEYAASVPSQVMLAERIGLLPAQPAAYDQGEVRADPVVSAFRPVVEQGTPLPQVQVQGSLLPPLADALQVSAAGDASAQAALDDVATAYERLLSGFTTGPTPS